MSKKISQLARIGVTDGSALAPVAKNGANYSQVVGGVVMVTAFAGVTLDGVTDDTVGVTAAVAAAFAGGYGLYWPAGAAVTTASIPLLHSVRHRGPGAIKRGANTFYVEPTNSKALSLYVATTGSAANDGLSATEPMRGFQNAIDALKNYGPVLEGTWTVNFTGATFNTPATDYGTTVAGLRSRNPIVLQGAAVGGYPNVPTTIIARTGGATQGWAFQDFMNVEIRDVKFQDFTTGQGVVASYATRLKLTNVHGFNNLYGVYGVLGCNVEIVSGIFDGNSLANSSGAIVLNESYLQFGTTGAAVTNVISKGAQHGMYVGEASSAHCNATLQDNAVGARLDSNARCNFDTSDFKRNTVGGSGGAIRIGANSAIQADTATFNTGTADANSRNIFCSGGGMAATRDENTKTPRLHECTQNQVTHTGTVVETLLWSFKAFPKEYFPNTFNQSCLAHMNIGGRLTGTAGTKRIRVHLHNAASLAGISDGVVGGRVIADITIAAATVTDYWFDMRGSFGLAAQRVMAKVVSGAVAAVEGLQRFSVATSNADDWWLNVSVELGNAADTLIMDHRDLEIAG